MISRIELDNVNTRRFGDAADDSTMIGATASAQIGFNDISVTVNAPLNVTELAKLKTLLDEIEARVRGEIGGKL